MGGGICNGESSGVKPHENSGFYVDDNAIFNKKAFVNFADFASVAEFVEYIKFLDNDENAYLAMLNEPLILDWQIVKKNDKKLAHFLHYIFSAENPYRRGFGQWRVNLEKRYVRFQKTREVVNKIVYFYRRAIFLGFWKKLFAKKRK